LARGGDIKMFLNLHDSRETHGESQRVIILSDVENDLGSTGLRSVKFGVGSTAKEGRITDENGERRSREQLPVQTKALPNHSYMSRTQDGFTKLAGRHPSSSSEKVQKRKRDAGSGRGKLRTDDLNFCNKKDTLDIEAKTLTKNGPSKQSRVETSGQGSKYKIHKVHHTESQEFTF